MTQSAGHASWSEEADDSTDWFQWATCKSSKQKDDDAALPPTKPYCYACCRVGYPVTLTTPVLTEPA